MKLTLTLDQAAIEQALKNFVASQGMDLSGKTVEVSMTAGRVAGYTAEVTITGNNTAAAPVVEVAAPEKSVEVEAAPEVLVDPAADGKNEKSSDGKSLFADED